MGGVHASFFLHLPRTVLCSDACVLVCHEYTHKYNEWFQYYQIQGKLGSKTGGVDLLDVSGETVFVFYFKTCLPLSQRMESPLKL